MADPIKLDELDKDDNQRGIKVNFTPITAPASAKNGESFEHVFSEQQNKKEKDSKIVASLIAETSPQKSILGAAPPSFEKSLEEDKTSYLRKKLRFAQMIFVVIFLLQLGAAFYFYSELSPNFDFFGSNTTRRLTDVNISLRKFQTELNKYRYLALQVRLNDVSYQADRFFSTVQSAYKAPNDIQTKTSLLASSDEAKKVLPELLLEIQKNIGKDFVISTFRSEAEVELTDEQKIQQFEEDLRKVLREDRNKLQTQAGSTHDIKLIDNTIRLVGNQNLTKVVNQISIDTLKKELDDYQKQPTQEKEKSLHEFFDKILNSTKSDLSIVANLKKQRIEWSKVVQELEAETINVDKNYGQNLLYENLGGIIYNSYEFDTSLNKIVLSGSTKTIDGSNFTLMSNLIDQLEQSTKFSDVNMPSFSKSKVSSGTAKEGFIAHFKIDLNLEHDESSDKNKSMSLIGVPNSGTQSGVSRSSL